MDLLGIVQRVWRRLPLNNVPGTVVGNSDPQVQQMLGIVQQIGEELLSLHEWSVVTKTFQFTTVTDPDFAAYPEDWNRALVDASVWSSVSNLVPLSGPCNSDAWHYLINTPGVRFPGFWRRYTDELHVLGSPLNGVINQQYVSNNYIVTVSGDLVPDFTADSDTPLIPDVLFRYGALWQWKQSKGLDYAEDMATYERELERRIAADRGAKPITTRQYFDPNGFPQTWPGMVVPS